MPKKPKNAAANGHGGGGPPAGGGGGSGGGGPTAAEMPDPHGAHVGPRYTFAGGGYVGVDPQVIGEELAALEIRPGDYHRTRDVLDAARNPDCPLHACFTWDDDTAAERHRLNEARVLLRKISYIIVKGSKRERTPVYYHIRDAAGPRYVRADRVSRDSELRARAIDEILVILNGLRQRFRHLRDLRPLFTAVDDMIEELEAKSKCKAKAKAAGKPKKGK